MVPSASPSAHRPIGADDLLGLARLITARPDRIRVARRADGIVTNSYRERPWDGRSTPDLPYYVYLARDGSYFRLAFDLDAARGDVGADAATLRQLLTQAGITFIEAVSGPEGGRHLIATFREPLPAALVGELATHLARVQLPTLDPTCLCNPTTGGIRPPGAPHRNGGASSLITPPTVAAATLAAGNGRKAFNRLIRLAGVVSHDERGRPKRAASRQGVLAPRMERLQRYGDLNGEYRDRSRLAAAITMAYVDAGLPVGQFRAAALDPSCRGLDHLHRVRIGPGRYRTRTEPEILAAAERMWRGRVRFAERHPPVGRPSPDPSQEQLVEAVLAAAAEAAGRWGGQGGRSDRAVLDAFLDDVVRWHRTDVPASVRRLSERSGISRSAVARALRRLVRDGWLVPCTPTSGPLAATYRPAVPATGPASPPRQTSRDTGASGRRWVTSPAPPSTSTLTDTITIQSHDVFTAEGLGRYAAAVFAALTQAADTPAGLAARTGLSLRTVVRHLNKLAAAGLTTSAGPVWRAHEWTALHDAAAKLGVRGAATRRAEMHAAERFTYRWYLADFAARHGWTQERGLWQPGRHTLTTPDHRPAPSVPFPRHHGRSNITRALNLVLAGHGPAPESLLATQPPPAGRAAA